MRPIDDTSPQLFALHGSTACGERIARALGVPLSAHEERDFADGEHKTRPLDDVRDKDVFAIHSLYGDEHQSVNDKLCRLLFFIGALRDAGAARVTAVLPYLAYARQDRKTQPGDAVTTRYVATLFEAVGTDAVLSLDVHNLAAFQNAFRCRTAHIEAHRSFVDFLLPLLPSEQIVVVSPDAGGVHRAEAFRQLLAGALGRPVGAALAEKHRSGDVLSGQLLAGEIDGRYAIIVDDLVSTGTTLARTARACHERGARAVWAVVTHGLFAGEAEAALAEAGLERIVVCDSVPPFRLRGQLLPDRLTVLSSAPLFAEAIQSMHGGPSLLRPSMT